MSSKYERRLRQAQPSANSSAYQFMRFATSLILLLIFTSCGDWGWESIDTDNEEQLNIFGLISLDDSLESFIVVHKTLDTAGPNDTIVGYDTTYFDTWEWYNDETGVTERDTFWYDPPYIRRLTESLYVVKDATVTVSDGNQSYSFVRNPQYLDYGDGQYHWYDDIFSDPAVYMNTNGSFQAQPDMEYTLSITTPSGHHLIGSMTTPPIPRLKESVLADTVSINALFEVGWEYDGDYHTTIAMGPAAWDPTSSVWYDYICGSDQRDIIEPGDTTWVSEFQSWCVESNQDPDLVAKIDLRLRYVDENYYKYFLAQDQDVEDISNFLIGEGSIGTSYGVEGGFGVFGAMSSYWTKRYATP